MCAASRGAPLGGIRRAVGTALAYSSFQLPLVAAYQEREQHRAAAETIARRLEAERDARSHGGNGNGNGNGNGASNGHHAPNGTNGANGSSHHARRPRVVIAADALDHRNGITMTYRSLLEAFATTGLDVELLACLPPEGPHAAGLRSLAPLGEMPAPYYSEYIMRVPALADVLAALSDRRVDLVHVATPGPVGAIACIAARLLRLPLLASYHTELPEYGRLLSDGELAEEDVWRAVRMTFGHCDRVLAPSRATLNGLAAHG